MRIVILILAVLLVMVQLEVWKHYGMVAELEQRVAEQRQTNRELAARNQALAAEVDDLKSGLAAVEERARAELGLVREGEQFYLVVDPDDLSAEDLDLLRRMREGNRLRRMQSVPEGSADELSRAQSPDWDGNG